MNSLNQIDEFLAQKKFKECDQQTLQSLCKLLEQIKLSQSSEIYKTYRIYLQIACISPRDFNRPLVIQFNKLIHSASFNFFELVLLGQLLQQLTQLYVIDGKKVIEGLLIKVPFGNNIIEPSIGGQVKFENLNNFYNLIVFYLETILLNCEEHHNMDMLGMKSIFQLLLDWSEQFLIGHFPCNIILSLIRVFSSMKFVDLNICSEGLLVTFSVKFINYLIYCIDQNIELLESEEILENLLIQFSFLIDFQFPILAKQYNFKEIQSSLNQALDQLVSTSTRESRDSSDSNKISLLKHKFLSILLVLSQKDKSFTISTISNLKNWTHNDVIARHLCCLTYLTSIKHNHRLFQEIKEIFTLKQDTKILQKKAKFYDISSNNHNMDTFTESNANVYKMVLCLDSDKIISSNYSDILRELQDLLVFFFDVDSDIFNSQDHLFELFLFFELSLLISGSISIANFSEASNYINSPRQAQETFSNILTKTITHAFSMIESNFTPVWEFLLFILRIQRLHQFIYFSDDLLDFIEQSLEKIYPFLRLTSRVSPINNISELIGISKDILIIFNKSFSKSDQLLGVLFTNACSFVFSERYLQKMTKERQSTSFSNAFYNSSPLEHSKLFDLIEECQLVPSFITLLIHNCELRYLNKLTSRLSENQLAAYLTELIYLLKLITDSCLPIIPRLSFDESLLPFITKLESFQAILLNFTIHSLFIETPNFQNDLSVLLRNYYFENLDKNPADEVLSFHLFHLLSTALPWLKSNNSETQKTSSGSLTSLLSNNFETVQTFLSLVLFVYQKCIPSINHEESDTMDSDSIFSSLVTPLTMNDNDKSNDMTNKNQQIIQIRLQVLSVKLIYLSLQLASFLSKLSLNIDSLFSKMNETIVDSLLSIKPHPSLRKLISHIISSLILDIILNFYFLHYQRSKFEILSESLNLWTKHPLLVQIFQSLYKKSPKYLGQVLISSLSSVSRSLLQYVPFLSLWSISQLVLFFSQEGSMFTSAFNQILLKEEIHFLTKAISKTQLVPENADYIFKFVFQPLLNYLMKINFDDEESKILFIFLGFWDQMFNTEDRPFFVFYYPKLFSTIPMENYSLAKWILSLSNKSILRLKVQKNFLVDDNPLFFYHLLISDYIYYSNYEDILREGFTHLIEKYFQLFKLPFFNPQQTVLLSPDTPSTSTSSFPPVPFLDVKIFRTVLLYLVWTLGVSPLNSDIFLSQIKSITKIQFNTDPIATTSNLNLINLKDRAKKALYILCSFMYEKTWSIKRFKEKDQIWTSYTSDLISKSFLYIVSQLLLHQWKYQDMILQEHCLRSLNEIIALLSPIHLVKFLPKILTIVDMALTSKYSTVRYFSVEILNRLIQLLPDDTLRSNVLPMIIGLYPLLESSSKGALDSISSTIQSIKPNQKPHALYLSKLCPSTIAHLPFPAFLAVSIQCHFEKQRETLYSKEIRKLSLDIIRSLLVKPDIKVFQLLQSYDFQDEFLTLLEKGTISNSLINNENPVALSFTQLLSNISQLFKHENPLVREIAIRKCRNICHKNKFELYNQIFQVNNDNENSLAYIIRVLLNLSTTESDETVLLEISKCLGEIGAIDPSLMRISTIVTKAKILAINANDENISNETNSVGEKGTNHNNENNLLPWNVKPITFGLYLLREYFIPCLKSATTSISQDRVGMAIQTILQLMASDLGSPVISTPSKKSKSNENDFTPTESPNQIPRELKELLVKYQILEITEPYWVTKYITTEKFDSSVINFPIFEPNIPFVKWLNNLCRTLISISSGRLNLYFKSCITMIRNSLDLNQFLLPYLIVDIIESSTLSIASKAYFQNIIQEITVVLQASLTHRQLLSNDNIDNQITSEDINSENRSVIHSINQSCVQSIFTLLDTYNYWLSLSTINDSQSTTSSSSKVSKSKKGNNDVNHELTYEKTIICNIQKIFDILPLTLLSDAAMSIKAYARALRYLETKARNDHRQKRIQSVINPSDNKSANNDQRTIESEMTLFSSLPKKIYDKASNELPVLSTSQINSLVTIYSHLEDSDGLLGAQIIRRIYGFQESSRHRILELEQSDDWLTALLEYELQQNSPLYHQSLVYYYSNSSDNLKVVGSSQHLLGNNLKSSTKLTSSSRIDSLVIARTRGTKRSLDYTQTPTDDAEISTPIPSSLSSKTILTSKPDNIIPLEDICDIEKGKLRCLIELGHLESVIYHAAGRSNNVKQLQSALIPYGIEASWRLMKWDELDSFLSSSGSLTNPPEQFKANLNIDFIAKNLSISENDLFRLKLGKIINALHHRDLITFRSELLQTRMHTMALISSASMESYGRAYPYLCRLHTLSELETGLELFQIVQQPQNPSNLSSQIEEAAEGFLASKCWEQRLNLMSNSMETRGHLLAIRRAIFNSCSLPNSLSKNWLQYSNCLLQFNRFDTARMALKQAEQYNLDKDLVLLQECKILFEQGNISQALMMLEPTEIDLLAINNQLKLKRKSSSNNLAYYLSTEEKKRLLSERIYLSTKYMVQSQQNQGAGILDRFSTVIALNNNWSTAYYEFGKYYEFLYYDALNKESNQNGHSTGPLNSANSSSSSNGSNPMLASSLFLQSTIASSTSNILPSNMEPGSKLSYILLEKVIEKFGKCLQTADYYNEQELIIQVLPRLLTLWLTFTSLSENKSENTSPKSSFSPLQFAQRKVNDMMSAFANELAPHIWYLAFPQIVSRVLHRDPDSVGILEHILQRLLSAYPKQGIWHIASLIYSNNSDRKKIAKKILQSTYREMNKNDPKNAQMLYDSQTMFHNLITLASHNCKERKVIWKFMEKKYDPSSFIIPNQRVLTQCKPNLPNNLLNRSSSMIDQLRSTSTMVLSDTEFLYIDSFHQVVEVAASKAKPKTITITTTSGTQVKFLCKQEKDGDLRKDARMMEFNNTLNFLFQQNTLSRKKKLRLRTYAVVCLNEECGILEWVNNTACIRQLIRDAHNFWPEIYPLISLNDFFPYFVDMQTKNEDDINGLTVAYTQLIDAHNYRPCFHRWFVEKFPDPMEWLEARTTFTRSTAVWSGVGFVIGLGDRHTENILIDVTNGESVHVDFDCLFDKGLSLTKPEIIPFRLTSNLVDAMGVTGIEGCYRKTLELTLQILRDHKDILLAVLEPFLRDPTVAWGRSGRAQRQQDNSSNANANKQNVNVHDNENKEAKEMLNKISERLQGVYNLMHPYREKIIRVMNKRNLILPSKGLGASKDDFLPLSVAGQAQRLIEEATSIENLCQLYIGWQPWL